MPIPAARGFSLIEVLLSIFVLSVGAFGAITLQLIAMRTSQQSHLQTRAMLMASELADKLRVRMRLSADIAPFLFEFDASQSTTPAHQPSASTPCSMKPCSSADFIDAELLRWKQQLAASLPQAKAVVCRDHTATPHWQCGAAGDHIVIKIGYAVKPIASAATQPPDTDIAPQIVLAIPAPAY